MSKNSHTRLVKVIADIAIFLEFTDEERLDPDTAIEVMEQMSAELQLLDDNDRKDIINIFHNISKEYLGNKSEYVKELPDSLGLL
ncbi:hypothetical protein [Cedecea lapagei]|uniref:hypothetical protein n=1 Tax=Cedecea lapagei TaxID=158823 RepID=UPI000F82A6CD|nr:hypothetical protein [Cedecea lapagei]